VKLETAFFTINSKELFSNKMPIHTNNKSEDEYTESVTFLNNKTFKRVCILFYLIPNKSASIYQILQEIKVFLNILDLLFKIQIILSHSMKFNPLKMIPN